VRSWKLYVFVAGAVGIAADLPALLTGALAVEMTEDLAFGTAGLGGAIAMTRGVAMVASLPVGMLTDRIGAVSALRLSAVLALISALTIALFAQGWPLLAASLALAGLSIAIGQPAANRLLYRMVPARRQGVAFGLKQAAPPAAALLAGTSVSVLALTLGWRSAFLCAAVLAGVMLLGIGKRPAKVQQAPPATNPMQPGDAARRLRLPSRQSMWLAMGFALGTAAAVVIPAFYTATAVSAGTSLSDAGMVLALASAVTVAARVSLGLLADRLERGHVLLCSGMLALGTCGLFLLGTGDPVLLAGGAVIGMAALWGFNGVFWYFVVGLAGHRPGTITGQMSTAGHVGGSFGPLGFGLLVSEVGFDLSWLLWTVFGLAGALSFWVASRARSRQAGQP
jgi:predicted MFS family arabinose efflux permease|tara:strand:- start:6760 stop:7944 length:1185 start_codon:yes stop_codon:yes gene_type:complete